MKVYERQAVLKKDGKTRWCVVRLCLDHAIDERFGKLGDTIEVLDGECDACTDDQERAAIQSEGT